MMRQGTFSAYNLRPPESERQRQANVHCSNIEIAKKWKQKKIHNQMNGQRRSVIWTEWNRHSLDIIGVPYTYIWLLPNLASCNKGFIWV